MRWLSSLLLQPHPLTRKRDTKIVLVPGIEKIKSGVVTIMFGPVNKAMPDLLHDVYGVDFPS